MKVPAKKLFKVSPVKNFWISIPTYIYLYTYDGYRRTQNIEGVKNCKELQ